VHVGDPATGQEIRQLSEQQAVVAAIDFSPDGKLLASGSQQDGSVRLWEVETGKQVRHLQGHPGYVASVCFSADGRTLAVGSWREVRLWEMATGKERGRLLGHCGDVTGFAFSADGKVLASGGGDTMILLWDLTGRMRDGRLPEKNLLAAELAAAWTRLTGEDSAQAYQALWTLVASPQQAVPFLKKRLQPAAPVDTERINRLIKSLDDDGLEVREKATAELKKFGEQAEAALRKALAAGPSAEVRLRLESLLEKLGDPSSSAQRLHALRAVEVLDFIGTPEAQEVLK